MTEYMERGVPLTKEDAELIAKATAYGKAVMERERDEGVPIFVGTPSLMVGQALNGCDELPEGKELLTVLDLFLDLEEQARWRMAALENLLRSPFCMEGKKWGGNAGVKRRASIVYSAFPPIVYKSLTGEQIDRLSLLIEGKARSAESSPV